MFEHHAPALITIGEQGINLNRVTGFKDTRPEPIRIRMAASGCESDGMQPTQEVITLEGEEADHFVALWHFYSLLPPTCSWQGDRRHMPCQLPSVTFRQGHFWCTEHAPALELDTTEDMILRAFDQEAHDAAALANEPPMQDDIPF